MEEELEREMEARWKQQSKMELDGDEWSVDYNPRGASRLTEEERRHHITIVTIVGRNALVLGSKGAVEPSNIKS